MKFKVSFNIESVDELAARSLLFNLYNIRDSHSEIDNLQIVSETEDDESESVVTWPDSQVYMEHPDFDSEAVLINDEVGLTKYGSSAYLIPNRIIREIDHANTVGAK